MNYSVVLFGNRRGATIKKDYVTFVTADYKIARALIKANSSWGNIKEFASYYDAIASTNDFIIEIRGQGLSIKSFTDKQVKEFIETNNTID